jgi:hypothetical protein
MPFISIKISVNERNILLIVSARTFRKAHNTGYMICN